MTGGKLSSLTFKRLSLSVGSVGQCAHTSMTNDKSFVVCQVLPHLSGRLVSYKSGGILQTMPGLMQQCDNLIRIRPVTRIALLAMLRPFI